MCFQRMCSIIELKGIVVGFVIGVLTSYLLQKSVINYVGNYFVHKLVDTPLTVVKNLSLYQESEFFAPANIVKKQDRILCWIVTSPKTHSRARLIKETWGKRCDKLLFMSSIQGTIVATHITAQLTSSP